MALLEFDCGPAPERFAPQGAQGSQLLDHMAPLPALPSLGDIDVPTPSPRPAPTQMAEQQAEVSVGAYSGQ